jgi:hypothetical protein
MMCYGLPSPDGNKRPNLEDDVLWAFDNSKSYATESLYQFLTFSNNDSQDLKINSY